MYVRFPLPAFLLLSVVTLAACASPGTRSGSGAPDVITREQLADMGAGTIYEAVERYHPEWLRQRLYDQPAVVFVDGTRMGDPSLLYSINVNHVVEVRYMDASDATTRYGTGFGGGAIQVTTRTGRGS